MTKLEVYRKLQEEMHKAAFNSGKAAKANELDPNKEPEFSVKAYEDGYCDGIMKAMELLLELEV